MTDLGEGAVVPDVPLVREAIFDETHSPVELVLKDGVQASLPRYLGVEE
jgi:hypothetical protein